MIIKNNKNCNIKINDKTISALSAKEMFEKLGFYYEEREYGFSYDAYDSETGWLRFAAFDIKNKTVKIHRINIYWNYETQYTKHTHLDRAINKQIEELGWNK